MSEIDKQPEAKVDGVEASVTVVSDAVSGSAVSRRRLMRAGLSAAPVMLALKSQSVLAADICIKPSAFSSLKGANMKLSRMPNPRGYTCFSHGYWKNHAHPFQYFNKSKSYFLAIPSGVTNAVTAGFFRNPGPGGAYSGKTLQQVLEMIGNSNNNALARHVVGTFLTAVTNGDDPTKVLLTTAQCKAIWEGQGSWSPMTGVTWTYAETMDYFNYVYA